MKVILTGSTGRVGSAVLAECIANPAVTSIVALTRRPLDSTSPKVTNVLVSREGFLNPSSLRDKLTGSDACIWALGTPQPDSREIEIEYPLAMARLSPQLRADTSRPFTFILTSGAVLRYMSAKETDNTWIMSGPRKIKTAAVDKLRELAESPEFTGSLRVAVARPGLVTQPGSLSSWVPGSILAPTLGAGMVSGALSDTPAGQNFTYLENSDLTKLGQAALARRSA